MSNLNGIGNGIAFGIHYVSKIVGIKGEKGGGWIIGSPGP